MLTFYYYFDPQTGGKVDTFKFENFENLTSKNDLKVGN